MEKSPKKVPGEETKKENNGTQDKGPFPVRLKWLQKKSSHNEFQHSAFRGTVMGRI